MTFSLESLGRFLSGHTLEYVSVCLGVLVSYFIVVHFRYYRPCKGYILRAMWRPLPFLVAVGFLQTVLAFTVLEVFEGLTGMTFPSRLGYIAWGATAGIVVVMIPAALEMVFVRAAEGEQSLQKGFIRVTKNLNVLALQRYGAAIQRLKEEDSYDCVYARKKWDLGLPAAEVSRRLRLIFEANKLVIANSVRQPKYCHYDGVMAGQLFFLLVAHSGRKKIRRLLQEPSVPSPAPERNWDGVERRTVNHRLGPEDRDESTNARPERRRLYDDAELLQCVTEGTAIDYGGVSSLPSHGFEVDVLLSDSQESDDASEPGPLS